MAEVLTPRFPKSKPKPMSIEDNLAVAPIDHVADALFGKLMVCAQYADIVQRFLDIGDYEAALYTIQSFFDNGRDAHDVTKILRERVGAANRAAVVEAVK